MGEGEGNSYHLSSHKRFMRFLIQHQTAFTDPNQPLEGARIGDYLIKLKDDTPLKEPL